MKYIAYFLSFIITAPLIAQSVNPRLILCNENPTCTHAYQNGEYVQIISEGGRTISLSAHDTGKYLRVDVTVRNDNASSFDLMPALIWAKQSEPREKILKPQTASKMERSLERRTAWANGFTAMAGGMARQQSTTYTNSSGTATAYGSNGSFVNANYQGSSTSTTTAPDYAAQARAGQRIAENRQRVAAAEQNLESVVLRANTLSIGQSASGAVYFERGPKKGIVQVGVPAGDSVYQFPVAFQK